MGYGNTGKPPLFLNSFLFLLCLFADWEEGGAGRVVGFGRWSSSCRRQNKGK